MHIYIYIYLYDTYDIHKYGEYKCDHLFFHILFIRSHFHQGSWTERRLSQFHPGLGYIDLYLPLGTDGSGGWVGENTATTTLWGLLFFFEERCGDFGFGVSCFSGLSWYWSQVSWLIRITKKKLTWQWKIHHLKMYFLLKMGIFQCNVSFQGCITTCVLYMIKIVIAMIHRHKPQLSHHHEPSIKIVGKWCIILSPVVTIYKLSPYPDIRGATISRIK